jgi:hypothetical protein
MIARLRNEAPTFFYKIYIAGDYDEITEICGDYCDEVGLCVNISSRTYEFTTNEMTGIGEEEGVCIELINYPRFPTTKKELKKHAFDLADLLQGGLANQSSYTIMGKNKSWYFGTDMKDVISPKKPKEDMLSDKDLWTLAEERLFINQFINMISDKPKAVNTHQDSIDEYYEMMHRNRVMNDE